MDKEDWINDYGVVSIKTGRIFLRREIPKTLPDNKEDEQWQKDYKNALMELTSK